MRIVYPRIIGGGMKEPFRNKLLGGTAGVPSAIRRGIVLAALLLCGCLGHGAPSKTAELKDLGLRALAAAHGVARVTAVTTAPEGSHYVLDSEAARVYRFAPDGTVLAMSLDAEDAGWRPELLAVDAAGFLTISDRSLKRQSVYDHGGHLIRTIGWELSPSVAGTTQPSVPMKLL